jgi:Holliday junction resolvasome RuvABC endonuclease subunit
MAATILGISPGTRSFGIGVLDGGELIEWQVKTFKGRWSKEKMKGIVSMLEEICIHFRISQIAIKEVSPLRSMKNVRMLTSQIIAMAEKKGIKIFRFTLNDLKRSAGLHGRETRDKVMEFVALKYPVLKKEYLKERNNLNPYYLRMFEAIAAARLVDVGGNSFKE